MNKINKWIYYIKEDDKFKLEDKFLLEDINTSFPLSIWWIITWKCNLRCLHCYWNEEELPSNEVSYKEALLIAKKIIDSWIHRVSISWWEPMLRNDLVDIVEFLSDNWVSVIVSTNWLNVKKHILKLKKLRHIEFSLDWSVAEIHNRFRPSRIKWNEDSYDNAIEWIKSAVKEGLRSRVLTTLSVYNFNDLERIWKILTDLWVDEWHIWKSVKAWRARFIYDELNNWVEFNEDNLKNIQNKFPRINIQYNFPSKSSNYYALILPNWIISTQDTITWEKIELWSLVDGNISDYWNKDNFDIKWHYIKWLNIKP